ncbi:MAG: gamma-glutamylcyclotransferase family protein [Thermodesulfobacteriota bacterium]
MSDKIKKLFVYGTLLRGESRNAFLQDGDLLGSLDIPGELYITDMGYPAASFNENPNHHVSGELYELSGDKITDKIMVLDKIEGTDNGLFMRKLLRINGHKIFTYDAGEALNSFLNDRCKIESGSWRLHGSLAKRDPIKFARGFEKYSAKGYREFPIKDSSGSIHVRGVAPILVTAPHACAHVRMNKLKNQEKFTGSLAVILHSITGSHAFYTHRASEIDPNFYDESPFKKQIARIVKEFGIRFVLDIHGTSTAKTGDVFPGVGIDKEFLLGNDSLLDRLVKGSERFGIRLGSSKIFPASRQMTVTKFAARTLGIPGMQIEISERLRTPDKFPKRFDELVRFLADFLSGVETPC